MLSDNLDFKSQDILSSLQQTDYDLIREKMKFLTFKKGQLIFYDGGLPTGIFLLEKGKAKIFKVGLGGKEQIFYIYKKGDLLGYHALLCGECYYDSCEAVEDCEIGFISSHDFSDLVEKIPTLKTRLIQNMAHEFGVMVNTITILAQKNVRERLALYLLLLHERYQEEKSNQQKPILLSREDLANIVGTARETLMRLLKEFKEDNLVRTEKRAIYVNEISKLKKIAGLD
ncbi:MAG: CRP-like cAMP-binding protein [Arenicella sp.]|jgi:CRP-like cAMP-binding protein